MKILKLNVKGLNTFSNGELNIDFYAEKKVLSDEKGSNVAQLGNNFYTLNTLSFIGINASGKTTTLNIIQGILNIYINNESIDKNNKLYNFFEHKLDVIAYITDGKLLYKIESNILKDKIQEKIWFENEVIYSKKFTKSFKRNDFNEKFDYISSINRKKIEDKYLKNEDSIFSGILNQSEKSTRLLLDTMSQTNFNYLSINNVATEFIEYLDNSIEYISIDKNKLKISELLVDIKFKNQSNPIKCDWLELERYLSSGTIKGINILSKAVEVLESGGYLIIDEIENHLNKRIVISILELFLSKLNKNGATLIFSTHYVEILDTIERSDSIYVLNKDKEINLNKLSILLGDKDRSDKKKSDVFLSGRLNTAPDFNHYRAIKKRIRSIVEKGDNQYDH